MSETFESNQPMNEGQVSPAVNASEALSNYREGKPGKPFSGIQEKKQISADSRSLQDATENPTKRDRKEPDEVQYKEKDFDPNANAKNSGDEKKNVESKDEVSPKGEESDEELGRDSLSKELDKDEATTKSSSDEAHVEDEVGETKDDLLRRLEVLEKAEDTKAQESKRAEHEAQVKGDREAIKEGFKFNYDVSSHLADDSLPEAVRNFLMDDPEQSEAMSQVISHAVNKLVGDLAGFQSAQERVGQFDAEQAESQRQSVIQGLEGRGINPKVFTSKSFEAFESDPKNFAMLDDLAERFGFGTLEYSHLVHDAYQTRAKAQKADKAKTVKEDARSERDRVAEGQQVADDSRVVGGRVADAPPQDPTSPAAKLAAYRASKAKVF